MRLFINKGTPVASISKPETEVYLHFGGETRGVRFDVVTETGAGREASDYHIYCIDSQRDFLRESFADRTLYYGCTAIAAKSLDQNEAYEKLRPVTVVFIYIDQQATTDFIDEIRFYRMSDIKRYGALANPYTDKLSFVEVNLNNKANIAINSPLDEDIRAFVDLMTHGDDSKVIRDLIANPNLSESMREVIRLFGDLMSKAIKEKRVDASEFPPELGTILESEAYKMTFSDLLAERAAEERAKAAYKEKRDIAKEMLIDGQDIAKIVKYTKLTEDEVLEIRSDLNKTISKERKNLAKQMLNEKEDIAKIMKYTKLTKDEVLHIQAELNLPNAI